MKGYQVWIVVLALVAANLQYATAQIDSTVISQRSSITSTITSFTNNVQSKVSDYTNKLTSMSNDVTSQLSSASQTLTTFLSDSVIGASALAMSDVVASFSATLSASVSATVTTLTAGFTSVGSCVANKTQLSVNVVFSELVTASANVTSALTSSSSSNANNCRGKYSGNANDFVGQSASKFQDCLNGESTEQSRVSTILNDYNSIIRQNYQAFNNQVRYCSGLGSVSSRAEVKSQIKACFLAVTNVAAPIFKATMAQQITYVTTMLQLEIVASNNRVRSCISQVSATYKAMADAILAVVNNCLVTGQ
ncbi:uncharacterized protein LOC128270758 [Anopheles cruzii]|uniref:uncharacterized protein LOC128270758 n=1 Tax=Anopheles cruzii TaxID=68878 RepID=UPI0022EC9328|nr:uncharacterized protein LOC128270758 [Anopheles cruzii]